MVISWLKKVTQPKSNAPAATNGNAANGNANGHAANGQPATGNGPVAPAAPVLELSHDKIGQRAYEIWVRKGKPHGTSDQDWREAEAELRAELTGRPAEPLPNRPR